MRVLLIIISNIAMLTLFISARRVMKYSTTTESINLRGTSHTRTGAELRKRRNDCSIIARSFNTIGCIIAIFLIAIYKSLNIVEFGGFSINVLFFGLFSTAVYSAFPLYRMISTKYQNWHTVYIFYPVIIAAVILYIASFFGCRFLSFELFEAFRNGEYLSFTVLSRFAVALLSLYNTFIPIIYYRCLKLDDLFVRNYSRTIIFAGTCIFSLYIAPKEIAVYIVAAYNIWIIFFARYVAREVISEAKIAARKAEEKATHHATKIVAHSEKNEDKKEIDNLIAAKLWNRLERYMKEEEPWRNPDLRLEELARLVHTNRTTLSKIINTMTGCAFNEYLAIYRVEAFCSFARENPVASINDLFAEVGFKSASTAFKHFKRIWGETPNDYIRKNKKYPPLRRANR